MLAGNDRIGHVHLPLQVVLEVPVVLASLAGRRDLEVQPHLHRLTDHQHRVGQVVLVGLRFQVVLGLQVDLADLLHLGSSAQVGQVARVVQVCHFLLGVLVVPLVPALLAYHLFLALRCPLVVLVVRAALVALEVLEVHHRDTVLDSVDKPLAVQQHSVLGDQSHQ